MNDVDRLILEAWEKLGPKIMADPEELAKRLERRRSALLTRPPRAWCMAVRACDRRITPAHWIITPEHAMDLDHPEHAYEPIEHTVTIQAHALRKFCRPVRTDSWGEEVADVARQLGVSRRQLLDARWAGIFTERFIKGLGGKHGKPVPLIHSWTTLDPSGGNHFSRPDTLWGSLWEWLPDMIPDDFEQTIIRKPHYSPYPVPGAGKEYWDRRFRGWRWVCPGCKKDVSKIYYPLPPRTLFDFLGYDPGVCRGRPGRAPEKFLRYDLHQIEPAPPTFACWRCHRIRRLTRTDNHGWNEIVSHLTRGMLYGHEVEKPQWYRNPRKRARTRQLHRASPKRDAIFERLQLGCTIDQIAAELVIARKSVRQAMLNIYRQHGVKNRRELACKLGWKAEQPLNACEQIRAQAKKHEPAIESLLLEDLTYGQIARQLGLGWRCVQHAACRIYARHNLPAKSGRQGLAKKVGVELGGRPAIPNHSLSCSKSSS